MNTTELWQLFLQHYNHEHVFMIIAPRNILDQCPLASEPITRATRFVAGGVYVADSFDDVSGQVDILVHLFVWNVRIPIYRVRVHFSPKFGYWVEAWLDGQKVTPDEFFRRPVGICPDKIYGSEQASEFADEWGWRCGMVHLIEHLPNRRLLHKITWDGATTFDKIRDAIEEHVGRRRMLWICFPRDKNGELRYQETNPLFLPDGLA